MFNATTANVDLKLCRPKTSDHRHAMKWFNSLVQVTDTALEARETNDGQALDDRVTLQHATQLYGMFAQSGDERYLSMCEDFLRSSLGKR